MRNILFVLTTIYPNKRKLNTLNPLDISEFKKICTMAAWMNKKFNHQNYAIVLKCHMEPYLLNKCKDEDKDYILKLLKKYSKGWVNFSEYEGYY